WSWQDRRPSGCRGRTGGGWAAPGRRNLGDPRWWTARSSLDRYLLKSCSQGEMPLDTNMKRAVVDLAGRHLARRKRQGIATTTPEPYTAGRLSMTASNRVKGQYRDLARILEPRLHSRPWLPDHVFVFALIHRCRATPTTVDL